MADDLQAPATKADLMRLEAKLAALETKLIPTNADQVTDLKRYLDVVIDNLHYKLTQGESTVD